MRWSANGEDEARGAWWVRWDDETAQVTGTPWVISELYDRCSDLANAELVLLELIELAGWAHTPRDPPAPAS